MPTRLRRPGGSTEFLGEPNGNSPSGNSPWCGRSWSRGVTSNRSRAAATSCCAGGGETEKVNHNKGVRVEWHFWLCSNGLRPRAASRCPRGRTMNLRARHDCDTTTVRSRWTHEGAQSQRERLGHPIVGLLIHPSWLLRSPPLGSPRYRSGSTSATWRLEIVAFPDSTKKPSFPFVGRSFMSLENIHWSSM